MVSVNLVANTDLRTPDEFKQMVVKEDKGVVVRLGEIADVLSVRRTMTRTSVSTVRRQRSWESGSFPRPTRWR